MKYLKFTIDNYRAIKNVTVDVSSRIVPLVGLNECGKTTILQAIFCFDYTNDEENGGRHLENIDNLYSTVSEGPCKIAADIACKKSDIVEAVQKAIIEKQKAKPAASATATTTAKPPTTANANGSPSEKNADLEGFISNLPSISLITITRNISEDIYYSPLFEELSSEDNDKICQTLISNMPYILYNDDFNHRPVSEIDISGENDSDPWYQIFERVFRSANENYSLKTLLSLEERRMDSTLDAVKTFLNTALTEAWSKFSAIKNDVYVAFKVDAVNKKLKIQIKESAKGASATAFFVTDRSKGFIWYYNFIMKIRFNPKQSGPSKETIFLLDEPGSYLHDTAQSDLCKKLREISKKEGIVIYCTHSPRLLSPEYIPFNNIILVEKSKKSEISLCHAHSKNNTKSVRNTALQPVYEALMIPEYTTISENDKILCVEGIFDKYAIEIFAKLPTNVRILPSTTAGAIVKNIQYFLAYGIPYMALWDNDDEGIKESGNAKKHFGPYESVNFYLLPRNIKKSATRMEEMIEDDDYDVLRKALKLSSDAEYEAIIGELYHLPLNKRKTVLINISADTKANFEKLNIMMEKHFKKNKNVVSL